MSERLFTTPGFLWWTPADDGIPDGTVVTFEAIGSGGAGGNGDGMVQAAAGGGGGAYARDTRTVADATQQYGITVDGAGGQTYSSAADPDMIDIVVADSGTTGDAHSPGAGGEIASCVGAVKRSGGNGGDNGDDGGGGGGSAAGDNSNGSNGADGGLLSGGAGGGSHTQFEVTGRGAGGDGGATLGSGTAGGLYGGGGGGASIAGSGGAGFSGVVRASWSGGDAPAVGTCARLYTQLSQRVLQHAHGT